MSEMPKWVSELLEAWAKRADTYREVDDREGRIRAWDLDHCAADLLLAATKAANDE